MVGVGVAAHALQDGAASPNEAGEPWQLSAPKCDYGKPNANAPEELSQFAFLIGDYTINPEKWDGEKWTPLGPSVPPARWNGWYGLGGMAIYDEWHDIDPNLYPEILRGVNVRVYDKKNEQWKMMWTHTGSLQAQDMRAEIRGGKLTMWQTYPDRPDFYAEFIPVDDAHWHRIAYGKDDKDEWVPTYKLNATLVPCD